jgi:hypothetical protein
MKHYSITGKRNHGRPLKRLLNTWDRNGPTSGPNPWKIYDVDDDDISISPMNCPSIPALEERLLLVPHGQLLVL